MNIPVKKYKEYFNREIKVPYREMNTENKMRFIANIKLHNNKDLLSFFIPLETK
jgi:hypothetical protein